MDDKPGEWFVEWSFVLKIKRPFKTAGEGWRQITIVNITIIIIIIAPMLVFLCHSTLLGACQGQL